MKQIKNLYNTDLEYKKEVKKIKIRKERKKKFLI